jgi:hypothetical protein
MRVMLKACLRHEARSEMTRWWMLNAQTLHHLSSRNFAQLSGTLRPSAAELPLREQTRGRAANGGQYQEQT